MNLKRKHKTILAALLLALYAFIATPVSYWHQHNFENPSTSTKQHHATIAKSSAIGTDANCQICTHHYSVANDDAVKLIISTPEQLSGSNSIFCIEDISNPGYSQSNKGPPALL